MLHKYANPDRKLGEDPPHFCLLADQVRDLAIPIGEGVAQVQDDPDQVIASGVVQVKHASILTPAVSPRKPTPPSLNSFN